MQYKKEHLPIGKRRSGAKLLKVGFVVGHDTGNKNSTARNNADYYRRTYNEFSQSAHVFVDDEEAIELVPLNEKAWHVIYDVTSDNKQYGDDANDIALGIELCYFDDKERTLNAYRNYVDIIAGWMKTYNLEIDDFTGHFKLDPNRRTDPVNALKTIGKEWDDLVNDLKAKLKPMPSLIKPSAAAVKIGTVTMLRDVQAYARPDWKTQLPSVVKKDEKRHVYANKNGWYHLSGGEWLPSQSGKNFTFDPVPTKKLKPTTVKPKHKLKRVVVDGKQVGAFSADEGIVLSVSDALKKNAKKINVEEI